MYSRSKLYDLASGGSDDSGVKRQKLVGLRRQMRVYNVRIQRVGVTQKRKQALHLSMSVALVTYIKNDGICKVPPCPEYERTTQRRLSAFTYFAKLSLSPSSSISSEAGA